MSLETAENPLILMDGISLKKEFSLPVTDEALLKVFADDMPEPAVLAVWSAASVCWAQWDGKEMYFAGEKPEASLIYELRLFNREGEIHLVRKGNQFCGRCITDGEGEPSAYVDTFSRLWGEKISESHGFVTLRDKDRKIELTVPCEEEGSYYGLTTRNYVGINEETGQAGYRDYRFVSIEAADWEGGK